jgi:hypothetical protein
MGFQDKMYLWIPLIIAVVVLIAYKRRGEGLNCADDDGGMPCQFGCEWIDANSFDTAKACDCSNCDKCEWIKDTARCISRGTAVDAQTGETVYVGADVPQDLSNVVVGYSGGGNAVQIGDSEYYVSATSNLAATGQQNQQQQQQQQAKVISQTQQAYLDLQKQREEEEKSFWNLWGFFN